MAWTYVVPAQALETLAVQLPAGRRSAFLDRCRVELHAELTRRLLRGEGPGTVPTGMLHADIASASTATHIFLTGELSPEQIRTRAPKGRLLRSAPRRGAGDLDEALRSSGPDWVYPGAAADGLFRDAVDMIRVRGHVLVEEMLTR